MIFFFSPTLSLVLHIPPHFRRIIYIRPTEFWELIILYRFKFFLYPFSKINTEYFLYISALTPKENQLLFPKSTLTKTCLCLDMPALTTQHNLFTWSKLYSTWLTSSWIMVDSYSPFCYCRKRRKTLTLSKIHLQRTQDRCYYTSQRYNWPNSQQMALTVIVFVCRVYIPR